LDKGVGGQYLDYQLLTHAYGTNIIFTYGYTTGNVGPIAGVIPPGIWTHICVTVSKIPGEVHFFENGVEVTGPWETQGSFSAFQAIGDYGSTSPLAIGTGGPEEARRMGLLLPEQFHELRERCEFTQKEMGEIFQVGEKSWTRWESGKHRPSRSISLLVRALYDEELSLNYLLRRAGKPLRKECDSALALRENPPKKKAKS